MPLVRRTLFRLCDRLPLRVIKEEGRPYLERHYLFTLLGVRFYLHRFVDSDPDRGLHDHPWPWAGSLLLSGHYLEILSGGQRIVRRFNWLRGTTFHRVILPGSVPEVWTLFFHRATNSKPWGFQRGAAVFVNASGENRRDWWADAPQARFHPDRVPSKVVA